MEAIIVLLGLSMIVLLVYFLVTGTEIPQGMKIVLLICVGLMLLLCMTHVTGCSIPGLEPK